MKAFYEKWGWLLIIPLLGYGLFGGDKFFSFMILFALTISALLIAGAVTSSHEMKGESKKEEKTSKERYLDLARRLFTKEMAVPWWIIFAVLVALTYGYYEDNWYRW